MAHPNLVIREDGSLLIKNVKLSYPNLMEPYVDQAGKAGKYSAKFLLPQDTHKAEIQALNGIIGKMAMEKFKQRPAAGNAFLRNGEMTGKDEDVPFFIVSASEKVRPACYARDGKTVITKENAAELLYAGAIVSVLVTPWAQDNKFGKKINANLLAVQFVNHGPRIGRAPADTTNAFDDVSSEFGGDDGFGSEPVTDMGDDEFGG